MNFSRRIAPNTELNPTIRLDTARVKGAQPFILLEQGFRAIITGAEDLAQKTTKLGTTPIAVTMCNTAFEQLMQVGSGAVDLTRAGPSREALRLTVAAVAQGVFCVHERNVVCRD